MDPQQVVSLIPIRSYETVAEFGCGTGMMTVALGKYVYDGCVYAMDATQEMLDAAAERARSIRLGNVEPRLHQDGRVPLEDASVDGLFVTTIQEAAGQPEDQLREARRVLKDRAWLAVAAWTSAESANGQSAERRMTGDQVWAAAEPLGFRKIISRDLNNTRHLVVLRK